VCISSTNSFLNIISSSPPFDQCSTGKATASDPDTFLGNVVPHSFSPSVTDPAGQTVCDTTKRDPKECTKQDWVDAPLYPASQILIQLERNAFTKQQDVKGQRPVDFLGGPIYARVSTSLGGMSEPMLVGVIGMYVEESLKYIQCSEIFTLRNEKFHTEI